MSKGSCSFTQVPNDPLAVYRKKVDPYRWAHACGDTAREIRDSNYECHSCSDWGGCGGGCDVIGMECARCKVRYYSQGPKAGEEETT